ncbi:MAG: RsfS/YbeB/iojap family protein, partial [Deltaproteobacteria bacterium]|nr:RsfS/YbeB/iojap family protein [Deltaproteobacteria bacterium]
MTEVDPVTKARWIVEAALDLKAERPIVLDMRRLTSYADTFVILTGRSDRQVRSIAESIL